MFNFMSLIIRRRPLKQTFKANACPPAANKAPNKAPDYLLEVYAHVIAELEQGQRDIPHIIEILKKHPEYTNASENKRIDMIRAVGNLCRIVERNRNKPSQSNDNNF
ncbi:MAG: hypothetical protein L6Q57_09880 [Alphaproteobacteria bacterium]|nr:hypothetical protein [Alphaproteobacteria bacterium]